MKETNHGALLRENSVRDIIVQVEKTLLHFSSLEMDLQRLKTDGQHVLEIIECPFKAEAWNYLRHNRYNLSNLN